MMLYIRLLPKSIIFSLLIFSSLATPKLSRAWGPDGHRIVAEIAMQLLKPEIRQNIIKALGTASMDTAGNWMDMMRSNSDYDFMKPWHYIDFDKGQNYQPSTDENIVNRLIITFNELRHRKTLCSEQVRTDLLVLFHLMGDLHQPLHTGYDSDLGGNKVSVQYDTLKTNLHHFWDEEIIERNNITLEDCMKLYSLLGGGKADTISGFHPVRWMKETRSFLGSVYDFPGFTISKEYMNKNKAVVTKQLLLAGMRLSATLEKLFPQTTPGLDLAGLFVKYKNAIDARDVMKFIGKKVMVCSKVFGVKSTENTTFINVGERYPNSPLTIVIFKKDRANFKGSIEDMYSDKNICVQGTIVEYKGKAEIIVTRPDEIVVE